MNVVEQFEFLNKQGLHQKKETTFLVSLSVENHVWNIFTSSKVNAREIKLKICMEQTV